MLKNKHWYWVILTFALLGVATGAYASEADIHIPDLTQVKFEGLGGVTGSMLMYIGIGICAVGALFGLLQYKQTKALDVHESMAKVS